MVNAMKRNWILRIGAVLLLLALTALPVGAQAATYRGLDVSVWQGAIDFAQVRASGKEVVYIRAGYGHAEDTRFCENAANARQAGMKTGFYFYVTATNTAQARQQAAYFAELIREVPYDCRPAVDFEQYGSLSKAELNAIALAFAETLESRTGITPVFYTNAYSAASIWEAELTRYPLWIADYGPSEPASIGHWRSWVGFQYADNGRVPGISGNVDLDRFTDGVFVEETNRPFVDVSPQAWYGPAVGDLYQKNLIQGVTSDRFAPDRPAQRAEVVTLLYRMAGEPAVTGASGFVDVPADAWYASAVRWAEEKGIAQGVGASYFAPTQAVTRQEMAVFLYRYGQEAGYDVSGQASLSRYADRGAVAPWAQEAVQWAVEEGILQGTASDTLAPNAMADRAQMAVMADRFLLKYPSAA